jgi:lysophospholipase L1-like esterase
MRPLLSLAFVAALLSVACGDESPPSDPGTGGASAGTGQAGAGKAGSVGAGGASAGTGGSPAGGQGGTVAGGGGTAPVGGAGVGGSAAGTAGTGGLAAGGAGGAGGAGVSGSAGTDAVGGGSGAGGSSGAAGAAGSAGSAGAAGSGGGSGGNAGTLEWLPSWATTIQGYESDKADHQPAKPLPNNTLRQFVWPTFSGGQVRVQLSNEKGAQPLQIQKVHIALAKTAGDPGNSMGAVDAASSKPLTFSGAATVTVPAGQTVWSDGVDFPLEAMKLTALTIQFGAMVPTELTTHPGARTTSYFSDGDTVAQETPGSGAGTRDRWYFINAIEVMAPADAFALAALGDSITDGYGILNKFERWTDFLTVRIQADATLKNKVSVLNFGMGANNLTSSSVDMDAGKDRFRRDVLTRPKVKWVIVLEGVNDINGGVQSGTIVQAYKDIVMGGHEMGIKIFGSPITPMGSNNSVRTSVNQSVRTEGYFDAIVDFDAAIRDSGNQNNIASMYNNDGLHPSAAGYEKMAAEVDLALLVP